MLSPSIHAALAHERHQEFLARAEADRRARQARSHRLRDGTGAARGFARLSAWSRQLRFLSPEKELSPAGVRCFTDGDHHDHEALGALDHPGGRAAGDPQAAETAVTIIDDRQGRGLGPEPAAQLCR